MDKSFKDWDEISEMELHFRTRTQKHIKLVQKYAKKIEEAYPNNFAQGLFKQSIEHDGSKFEEPEYTPYLHIGWKYKMQDDGKIYNPPEDIKNKMNQATEHHVKNNKHHPEFWTTQTSTINPNNRDEPPKEMIDATKMPDNYIAELVSDWMAMGEEKGTNPFDWAKKNVNVRWKFTDQQTSLIYDILNRIWGK